MEDYISIQSILAHGVMPFKTDSEQLIYCLLRTNVSKIPSRQPVNFIFLIDGSGSMNGDTKKDWWNDLGGQSSKIESTKTAVIECVKMAHPGDAIGVVVYQSPYGGRSYTSHAHVVVPSTVITESESNKAGIIAAIKAIQAEGDDVLSEGIPLAIQEAQKFADQRITKILWL